MRSRIGTKGFGERPADATRWSWVKTNWLNKSVGFFLWFTAYDDFDYFLTNLTELPLRSKRTGIDSNDSTLSVYDKFVHIVLPFFFTIFVHHPRSLYLFIVNRLRIPFISVSIMPATCLIGPATPTSPPNVRHPLLAFDQHRSFSPIGYLRRHRLACR